jgi:hypothetical protein
LINLFLAVLGRLRNSGTGEALPVRKVQARSTGSPALQGKEAPKFPKTEQEFSFGILV